MILNGKIINPGQFRTRIVLSRRVVTNEAGRFPRTHKAFLATAWCRWTNAHGQETILAEAQQVEAAATVLIRYNCEVDQTCIVTKAGEDYEIVAPPDDIQDRHQLMELRVRRWRAG